MTNLYGRARLFNAAEFLAIETDAQGLWVADDGLMCLAPRRQGGDREPYSGQPFRTANNDNGVYFLALYMYLRDAAVGTRLPEFGQAVTREIWKRLQVSPETPGLTNRNPGRSLDTEAFDNPLGLVALGVLFGVPVANAVRRYGNDNGGTFNNVEPGKYSLNLWRQGAEFAFYDLADGKPAKLYELAWLVIATLLTACLWSTKRSSEHLTAWLRLKAIMKSADRPDHRAPKWMFGVVAIAFCVWLISVHLRFGGVVGLTDIYFERSDHPIRRMAALAQKYGRI